MNPQVAQFMMGQIDERVARRKRPLDKVLAWKLARLREAIIARHPLTKDQEELLQKNYERFSDPNRLKWGHAVRLQ